MKEIRAILDLYKKALESKTPVALATVVNKFGSAYRRPGARMLITADGQYAGSISGGCVERDLIERAYEFCTTGTPQLLTYQAETDDPYDFGSGCEGIIFTLVEPLNMHADEYSITNQELSSIDVLLKVYESRQTAYQATVFTTPFEQNHLLGKKVICLDSGTKPVGESFVGADLVLDTLLEPGNLFENGPAFSSTVMTPAGSLGIFFEKIEPPIRLIIFGAGDDVRPLSAIAAVVGIAHNIVDFRPGLLSTERFPDADRLMQLRADQYPAELYIDQFTACVVMHHHYSTDKAAVQFLIEHSNASYIGLLGPRKRADRMLAEIREHPLWNSDSRCPSLFGPVGLDIGAETPEEIALSIVAEIKAFYRNKTGLLLRDKNGPIHDSFDRGDEITAVLDSDAAVEAVSAFELVQLQCRI